MQDPSEQKDHHHQEAAFLLAFLFQGEEVALVLRACSFLLLSLAVSDSDRLAFIPGTFEDGVGYRSPFGWIDVLVVRVPSGVLCFPGH